MVEINCTESQKLDKSRKLKCVTTEAVISTPTRLEVDIPTDIKGREFLLQVLLYTCSFVSLSTSILYYICISPVAQIEILTTTTTSIR